MCLWLGSLSFNMSIFSYFQNSNCFFLQIMINSVLIVRIIIILSSETCKFDFEAGIDDWEKTGSAFNNQPTYGDNPTARNRGQPANQQGDWWIGGYENRSSRSARAGNIQGDTPQGTLTSPYFKINGGQISFLIGGGCDIKTVRAELIVGNKVRLLMLKIPVSFICCFQQFLNYYG